MNSDKEHHLDNIFKKKLENIESPIEKGSFDALFELANLETNDNVRKLPAPFYKKFYPYAAAAAFVCIALFIGLFYNNENNSKKIAEVSLENTKATPEIKPLPSDLKIKEYLSVNEKVKDSNKSAFKKKNTRTIKNVKKEILPIEHLSTISLYTEDSKKEYILPDSSIVTLNQYSTLSYASDFLENRILKMEGEVFFSVRKYKNKTFKIETANSFVEVLGTSFNIKSSKDDLIDKVSVVTGKVSVESKISHQNNILIKGQEIFVFRSGKILLQKVNENELVWKTNKINFQQDSLKNILPIMEKYFEVKLNPENQDILNCSFTGKFEKPTIDEFLQILSSSLNLSYKQNGNVYLLNGNGCK